MLMSDPALMFDEDAARERRELLSWPEEADEMRTNEMDASARRAASALGFDLDEQLAAVLAERERLGIGPDGRPLESAGQ